MNKEDLKELNALFNEVKDLSEEEVNGYFRMPDGNYNAVIDDLEITESKNGNPMFVLSFKITDGEYKDQIHKQFIMLSANNEDQLRRNINRYATTIKKLGVDTTAVKDMSETFDKISIGLNKKVILKIETTVSKQGNPYTNTSFDLV